MRNRNASVIMAVLVAAGLGAGACSAAPDGASADAAIPGFEDTVVPAVDDLTVAHGLEAFPAASPRDWVSYADHVSLFTVIDEQAQPWGEHEQQYGEGMVGRDVTVRVDQVLWRSPTTPAIPGQYTAGTDGWALYDRKLSPMGLLGGPRLEVGDQYLGAWIHSSQAGWAVLSVSAAFPVDEFGRAQRHEWAEPSLASSAVVGQLPWQVSWTLSTTRPDPQVARYAHLEPWQRRLAIDFAAMPDRPGFLKATRERVLGGELGYVREADWQRLQTEHDPSLQVPFYTEAGPPAAPGQGGGITIDGYVQPD